MKKKVFFEGLRDGLPIGLGYFAVAFSLGIVARNAGLTPVQGFIASFFNVASAGEYALFTSIQAGAKYLEIALITLVVNARYLLMSTALTQRFDPKTPAYFQLQKFINKIVNNYNVDNIYMNNKEDDPYLQDPLIFYIPQL